MLKDENEIDPGYKAASLLCLFPIWTYQVSIELKDLKKAKKCDYLKNPWNYFDLASMALNAFVVVTSFEQFRFFSIDELRAIASFASTLMTVKIFDWLRLFESTAFFILLID